ncbi:hypothetical protein GY12_18415 [Micrococcus luteus]|nr:hypothetical protein GY12_18415 [Micrococcus luteus]
MTMTTLTRKTALTGTGVLAALALAACGTTVDNGDDGSASPEVDASSAVASTPRHGRRLDHVGLGVVVGLLRPDFIDVVLLVDVRRGRQRLGHRPG